MSDRTKDFPEAPTPPPSPEPASTDSPSEAAAHEPKDVAPDSGRDKSKAGAGVKFPIVGIGASAGGLEALEALTRRLSSDGMCFVVLQHLAPGHESMLSDILARGTSMNVVTVRDSLKVEINTIYVTPPNTEIVIDGGSLYLTQASDRVPRLSIDAFFRTLAAEAGTMAIGVVLSGAGTDGTLGLRAIKEEGGITFAQDPSTASHPSMPQSAIDSGAADFSLSPMEIGDELMRLSAHPYVARRRPRQDFSEATLRRLFDKLRKGFGVDFSAYKAGTVERRVERRMALQKIERLEDYIHFVESSSDELSVLYTDLLIGVTGFFRDRLPFEGLKNIVFPRLLKDRHPDIPIRIWVPGCSTGEEAYSVAICLLEFLGGGPGAYKVHIFGTDIDDEALARARQGTYPQNIELDVSPERLQRFFTRHDKAYQVSRQIRDMVVFARHNLGKDPPFSRLDLISCRNVLIYMQPPLQRKVLRVFHYALNHDGCLILGSSETVGDASDLFSLLDRRFKLYVKKDIPSAAVFDFAFKKFEKFEPHETHPLVPQPPLPERRPFHSLQQLADRKVLDRFGPPGVLIDDKMEIIQFRGQTGPFLGPTPGTATLNIMKLVRPEFLVALRSTLQKAMNEHLPQMSDPVPLHGRPGDTAVVLDVMPVQQPGEQQRRCYLILFRELPASSADVFAEERAKEKELGTPHLQELERDLLVTREYLQTTVQELEAANEELQSSNEELQSSNEELQSTNEELETSKEELQSTNEELGTVNEELQNRMVQLSIANDDLLNVLSHVSVPFVIVNMEMRLRRFSAEAERLLNLLPEDIGRPIGHLGTSLNAPQLEREVLDCINSVRERGQRVRCADGHWYTARIIPYRTAEHTIRGAFIEFMKVPSVRRIGEPYEVHEFVGKVLSTLPHVLMLLDETLRITWVNRAFFETFAVGAEVLGRSLDDIWAGRTSHPELWNALEDTAAGGKPLAEMWITHPFRRKSDRPMKFTARHLPPEGERPALTLVVMEEANEWGGTAS